ncbi:hypothetical protein PFHG_05661, partial [Plasmodium falciparum HB3]
DILINNKITNILYENKKGYSTKKILNDINNTHVNTNSKENASITIHVKITESFSSSRNDTFDGKNLNTSLARLSLIYDHINKKLQNYYKNRKGKETKKIK